MGGDNKIVFDHHDADFVARIMHVSVLVEIGNVLRLAVKNPTIIRLANGLRPVGVCRPIDFTINEMNAAGFVARIGIDRHEYFPIPRVSFLVVGAAQPMALVSEAAIDVTRECVLRLLG